MPILHAVILGLVQGLSEFLPISSSGHLLLVPWLFNWHDFDNSAIEKAFDVALHLGTLAAVVGYFRRDLVVYVREGVRLLVHRERPATPEGRLAWLLVLSSIPAAIVGALFEKTIDDKLGTPGLIAASLILFGVLLGIADRRPGRTLTRRLPKRRCPQGRCRPGSGPESRHVEIGDHHDSGTVPGLHPRRRGPGQFPHGDPGDCRAPLPTSCSSWPRTASQPVSVCRWSSASSPPVVSGWAAVWGTLRLIRTRSFMPFVIYRCALGVAVFAIMATGWR